MKHGLKLISLMAGILALIVSANSFALAPPSTDENTNHYHSDGRWYVGIDVFYFKPSTSDLDYAVVDSSGISNPIGGTKDIETEHEFEFGIEAGYRFPNSDNDITIVYNRIHTEESDSAAESGSIWPTLLHPRFTLADDLYDAASADVEFDLDTFDLLVGKEITIGVNHDLDVHMFTGLRYVMLDAELDARYVPESEGVVTDIVDMDREFNGIGPRIGVNGNLHVGSGFGFHSSIATTLLIGNAEMSTVQIQDDEGLEVITNVDKDTFTHLVPELDANLGAYYAHHFDNEVIVSFDLGWKWINYFNILDRFQFHGDDSGSTDDDTDTNGPDTTPVIANAAALNHNVDDLAYNGPYLSIKISG